MLKKFFKDESGQGMVEYALIIALIAVVVIVAVTYSIRWWNQGYTVRKGGIPLFSKLKKSEKGQSIVEFALVLPLLLTLLCGVIDFGWIYSNQYRVENASYAGAGNVNTNITLLLTPKQCLVMSGISNFNIRLREKTDTTK